MAIQTLRPGILVGLKTSRQGNVKYFKEDIEREHRTAEGEARAKWETTRLVEDPEEFVRAQQAQGRARTIISAVCARSDFGLLCPQSKEADLERAIEEAREVVDAFNASATITRVRVYVMRGRVSEDDVEAVRAINSEVRDLLSEMESGIEKLDAEQVRKAANKARSIGQMLTPDAASRIQAAVEAARSSARRIVKAGEQAAQAIDTETMRKLAAARTEFLDLDDAAEIAAPATTGRAIDFDPAPVAYSAAPAAPTLFDF